MKLYRVSRYKGKLTTFDAIIGDQVPDWSAIVPDSEVPQALVAAWGTNEGESYSIHVKVIGDLDDKYLKGK